MNKARYIGIAAGVGMVAMALPALAATTISVVSGDVTSMASNQLMVKVGKNTYTTTESSATVYTDAGSHKLAPVKIQVGDHVWVWGVKNTTAKTMTGVTKVKDVSTNRTSIMGTIATIATNKLTVKVGSATYMTSEGTSTKYWNKTGVATKVSTLKAGDKVTVWGLVDTKLKNVANVTDVKDRTR